MKSVKVVAAVIRRGDEIYASQRGYGDQKGFWEFPGGKAEAGETQEEALKREIKEELDLTISVGKKIGTVEYDYPTFHLSMDAFLCTIEKGTPILKEAMGERWLKREELNSLNWLPADEVLLPFIGLELENAK